MKYLDVPCNKLHMNSGPDKPDYKCIFIYKHYAMKSKMPQSNIEEGRRKLKGKVKGWKDTVSRKG
jgi:hypothetical protein